MNRAHRLRSSRDFRRALRRGVRAGSGPVACVAIKSDRSGPARVGFSVTKRTGNAVERNHVKRRLREAIRPEIARVDAGVDLVLLVRGDVAGRNFQILREDVQRAVEEAVRSC